MAYVEAIALYLLLTTYGCAGSSTQTGGDWRLHKEEVRIRRLISVLVSSAVQSATAIALNV